jgi:hypothetical protein
MQEIVRAVDERGIILSAPLQYATLEAVVQCLSIANAETLREKMWPFMDAAGLSMPQESRVPCDLLRAATLRLRKWRETDPQRVARMWDDGDDATLSAAWRDGLNAREDGSE